MDTETRKLIGEVLATLKQALAAPDDVRLLKTGVGMAVSLLECQLIGEAVKPAADDPFAGFRSLAAFTGKPAPAVEAERFDEAWEGWTR